MKNSRLKNIHIYNKVQHGFSFPLHVAPFMLDEMKIFYKSPNENPTNHRMCFESH